MMSRSVPRAMSYPFAKFLENAAKKLLPKCTYTVKYDGFRIVMRKVDGEVAYFTKAGNPIRITDTPKTMMEAILLYLRTNFPGLSPDSVVDEYVRETKGLKSPKRVLVRSCATELHLEFMAVKDGRSYMRGLWNKECLDPETGRLNERDFAYSVVGFDCVFDEDGDDLVYWRRREVLLESLGCETVCLAVEGADEMLDFLLKEEGLVFHEANGTCWKVKMPRVVMNLSIVAVANTIPDFDGYNMIYMAAPNEDATLSVVHVFDWTDLFTKYENPSKGRPFINPKSVKIMDDGRLGCSSSCKSMQPLVNAVFRAVSENPLLPASGRLTKTKAVARVTGVGEVTLLCGDNRSFSFIMPGLTKDNGPKFLTVPVKATVGCCELWEIGHGELHLQPAWMLALDGYGPVDYMTMAFQTSTQLLRTIANDPRNDPKVNYEKVGMQCGPFLDQEKQIMRVMKTDFFFVPQ